MSDSPANDALLVSVVLVGAIGFAAVVAASVYLLARNLQHRRVMRRLNRRDEPDVQD